MDAGVLDARPPPTRDDDDDLLPGVADVAAVDRPREGGSGYLWDVAKAKGLRVRNYGCFFDGPAKTPPREPFVSGVPVGYSTALGMADDTDAFYRGFDMTYPDFWRVREWQRELGQFEMKGDMPELVLVRLPHDHFGLFGTAIDGLDTPDTQMADHDYALGMLVESLSRSRFWEDTIVIALEDDAQDGADHVDAHRSLLFFAGGHASRGVVSHTTYTTPSVLRTLELLLGLPPLARRDAVAPPIAEALMEQVDHSPFEATVPDVLRSTRLPLPPRKPTEKVALPRGSARYWAQATASMRFDREDELDSRAFNTILARGLGVSK
jgi:hypothetical protein